MGFFFEKYKKKIINLYKFFLYRINTVINNDIAKVAVIFLFSIIFYLLFESVFTSILFSLFVVFLFFRFDGRFFILIGLIFLFFCLLFLIFKQRYWAEDLAVYSYYLFCFGILIEFCRRVFSDKLNDKDKSSFGVKNFTAIILLLITLCGFYYVRYDFKYKLEQQNIFLRELSPDELLESKREIDDLKEDLQEVLIILNKDTKEIQQNGSDFLKNDDVLFIESGSISLEILNGTYVAGAASKLSSELKSKGYEVVSIGNEINDYVNTVIKYKDGKVGVAEKIKSEINYKYSVVLEKDSGIENDILIIIGQEKNEE